MQKYAKVHKSTRKYVKFFCMYSKVFLCSTTTFLSITKPCLPFLGGVKASPSTACCCQKVRFVSFVSDILILYVKRHIFPPSTSLSSYSKKVFLTETTLFKQRVQFNLHLTKSANLSCTDSAYNTV